MTGGKKLHGFCCCFGLIKLVEFYLEDGLEIAGHLVMTQGKRLCTVTVDSYMVLKCMPLCSTS